jgi:small subunit ribosomal protein S16
LLAKNVYKRAFGKGIIMSVKIRLARRGTKKRPVYALVATNSRSSRDGKFLEKLGTYNPLLEHGHALRLIVNAERVKYWIGVGAEPSERAAKLLSVQGIVEKPAIRVTPSKSAVGKKMTDRAEARAKKAQERADAEAAALAAPAVEEAAAPAAETSAAAE